MHEPPALPGGHLLRTLPLLRKTSLFLFHHSPCAPGPHGFRVAYSQASGHPAGPEPQSANESIPRCHPLISGANHPDPAQPHPTPQTPPSPYPAHSSLLRWPGAPQSFLRKTPGLARSGLARADPTVPQGPGAATWKNSPPGPLRAPGRSRAPSAPHARRGCARSSREKLLHSPRLPLPPQQQGPPPAAPQLCTAAAAATSAAAHTGSSGLSAQLHPPARSPLASCLAVGAHNLGGHHLHNRAGLAGHGALDHNRLAGGVHLEHLRGGRRGERASCALARGLAWGVLP